MVLAPDGSQLIIGGAFTSLNGTDRLRPGLGQHRRTAAILPWAANQRSATAATKARSPACAPTVTDLRHRLLVRRRTATSRAPSRPTRPRGTISTVEDCHGDTYDVLPLGQVMYTVSHAHDCSAIGWLPRHRSAGPLAARPGLHHRPAGTITGPDPYGWTTTGPARVQPAELVPADHGGHLHRPGPGRLVAHRQRQLRRLRRRVPQGQRRGPAGSGPHSAVRPRARTSVVRATPTNPNAQFPHDRDLLRRGHGASRLRHRDWDHDNESLTYDVFRDGGRDPVYTTTDQVELLDAAHRLGSPTPAWRRARRTRYQVRINDAFGNDLELQEQRVTVSSGAQSQYAQDVLDDGAAALLAARRALRRRPRTTGPASTTPPLAAA